MAAEKEGISFRQVRHVSGFSRPMSVFDAFIYNFLTMGVIFPWMYLWGPASFPGANLELAIWLTLLAQLPISLAYCFLATVLPVTGGDYIYQSRAFGKWGFVAVMSGFVIWILQWVALSGWLFATLGLAPWLLSMGVHLDSATLARLGLSVQRPVGVLLVSVFLALGTTLFLIRGLRLYVRVQRVLFVLTVAAIAVVVGIFLSADAVGPNVDSFVARLSELVGLSVSEPIRGGFLQHLKAEVADAGVNLSPPFSLLATLGVVPIAWTSLQWATYSVEQNTEIAEADRFGKQFFILVISAVSVAFVLWLVAHVEHGALGSDLMIAASAAYWTGSGSPETTSFVQTVVQPFPNILAMAATKSWLLTTVIALGFVANSFQVTCNCFIGVTRILVAMGTDGMLRPLRLDEVDARRHAPVRAHWFYFVASLPWIAAYSLLPVFKSATLGVTFACGYVFALSALAATRIPAARLRSFWKSSDVHSVSPALIRAVGYAGFAVGAAMVVAYLVLPQLGLTGTVPYIIVAGVLLGSYALYVWSRSRSGLAGDAWEDEPREVGQLYRDEP
jgi:amino acid transporter